MRRISYSEVLRIFSLGLNEIYYCNLCYVLRLEDDYYLHYCLMDNEFIISHNNKKVFSYMQFCYMGDSYGYMTGTEFLKIPQSKEEWFEFAIQYDCTEEDYNNFMKIVNHLIAINK